MSNQEGEHLMAVNASRSGVHPTMPTGTEVASYRTYKEASMGVDTLAEANFPIAGVTIVGSDLHMVEILMGKLTPGRVAFAGATQGLTWGLLLGMMSLFIMRDVSPLVPILAVVGGVTAGVLISIIMWSTGRRRKSYMSQNQMVATRYAILVSEQTDHAFKLLQNTPGNLNKAPKTRVRRKETAHATEFGSNPDEQPRFGVRLDAEERHRRSSEKTLAPPQAESTNETTPDPDARPEEDA